MDLQSARDVARQKLSSTLYQSIMALEVNALIAVQIGPNHKLGNKVFRCL